MNSNRVVLKVNVMKYSCLVIRKTPLPLFETSVAVLFLLPIGGS